MPSSATPQCSPRPLPQVTTRQTGARRITVRAHTPIIGAACGTGLPLLPISTQGTHALNAEDQKISSALLVSPPAVGESIEPRVAAGPAPRPKPRQEGAPATCLIERPALMTAACPTARRYGSAGEPKSQGQGRHEHHDVRARPFPRSRPILGGSVAGFGPIGTIRARLALHAAANTSQSQRISMARLSRCRSRCRRRRIPER